MGLRAGEDPRGLLPGPRRHPVCDRQVARGGAVRRHPLDGDQDRRSRRRPAVRRGHPRRVPGQDAGLQPVAVVQLGHHRHDRRRDEALPRGARQDGLRLQLHHLRRAPDRRRRRRGVRHLPQAGRHAGAGPPAAQDAPGRVALPHAADAGRRPAQRRRAGGHVGSHGDHQGHGQGLDPAPAPGADRGAEEAARGMAGAVERALPARREAARAAAAAARRFGGARARHLRQGETSSWPTSSSTPSRTATAAAFSRCATRTPSPRSCARSG